jgi:hypothetical protein
VGAGYSAKTTPHMYIINSKGTLVYNGGIDDKPTPNPADVNGARNHVLAALAEVKAGKPVSVPTSKPYGCNVKYKDRLIGEPSRSGSFASAPRIVAETIFTPFGERS